LYNGTSQAVVGAIMRDGPRKLRRHPVRLSGAISTASTVGRRHGLPVVCAGDAGALSADGYSSSRSENGVWLLDAIAAR
jgi:putative RNA 2'-phosphotransferase